MFNVLSTQMGIQSSYMTSRIHRKHKWLATTSLWTGSYLLIKLATLPTSSKIPQLVRQFTHVHNSHTVTYHGKLWRALSGYRLSTTAFEWTIDNRYNCALTTLCNLLCKFSKRYQMKIFTGTLRAALWFLTLLTTLTPLMNNIYLKHNRSMSKPWHTTLPSATSLNLKT